MNRWKSHRYRNMKCQCGHMDYNHRQDVETACVWEKCPCLKFSPAAGQRGLMHLWIPYPPHSTYTKCRRVANAGYCTMVRASVNCPDCLRLMEEDELERKSVKAGSKR
jgi:hypothetical protein